MSTYPNLLSPLKIGTTTIPNRMVMGAMHTRLETLDRPHERLAAFYAARARGEVGLILTGGFSPVPEGVMDEGGPLFDRSEQVAEHRYVTSEVEKAGGTIVLQILHAGRYAKVPTCVSPSPGKARINLFPPRPLTTAEVRDTVQRFVATALLAREAGYRGVEIMGSEGYLINEFTAAITNQRDDEYGGSFENRLRFPLEIVEAVRAAVGADFIVIYRISSIDLMDGGMTASEIAAFAQKVERAGADLINVGVGWHESAVPTIGATVPRAAWTAAVRNVKQAVTIPVMASNRINAPDVAEQIIASGAADLVSMARPLLADPDFAKKTRTGRDDEINTCIACNQACLDRIFTERTATCLVNPRAGREIEFDDGPTREPRRFAVVGAGPAGLVFAIEAARRGHTVTLFEAGSEIGGQLNLAKVVPGKEEFHQMLRYFGVALQRSGVTVRLNTRVTADDLSHDAFDEIVIATGVLPRTRTSAASSMPRSSATSTCWRDAQRSVIASRSSAPAASASMSRNSWSAITPSRPIPMHSRPPGVSTRRSRRPAGWPRRPRRAGRRHVHMFQRKHESLGRNLGKSTGWILKAKLRKANVAMTQGTNYDGVDDAGLHYSVAGEPRVLEADHVVLCAGQIANRELHDALLARGVRTHLIGGADVALELDALRAIDQATRLAVSF